MSEVRNAVLKAVSENQMLNQGDRVLCCVSGGADSVAMLHLLSRLADTLGISVCAIHVNHGLRGEESNEDEAFVRELCVSLGVELTVQRLSLTLEHSIEETARELRYQAFFDTADLLSCNRIATAHTENDNAETVLLHLARGSGLHGLTGIPAVRGRIIRPLIFTSRAEVLAYLRENSLSYREDSSNASVEFSRNRVRHRVFSELSAINPEVVRSIANTAHLLKQDEDYILREVERSLSSATEVGSAWRIPCKNLGSLHPAISSRVILALSRRALDDQTYSLESARISDVTDLVFCKSPSAELHLPSNLIVRRVYDSLEFSERTESKAVPCELREGGSCRFGRFVVRWLSKDETKIHKNFILYELDSAIIGDCITVRSRKIGDCIKRENRPNRSLKRLMIDEKIEKNIRDELPVLADDGNLILVHGIGIDERYLARINHEKIRIEIGLCCDETERSTDQ